MDILLIAELCISIYIANKTPEMLTPVFMKYFFTMCIPTLILAKLSMNVSQKPIYNIFSILHSVWQGGAYHAGQILRSGQPPNGKS